MYMNEKEKNVKDDSKRILAVVTLVSKNRMTIPRSVRNRMSLERGDTIVFLNCQNHIGFVKMKEEYLIDANETE